jgi:hypothetical protein
VAAEDLGSNISFNLAKTLESLRVPLARIAVTSSSVILNPALLNFVSVQISENLAVILSFF